MAKSRASIRDVARESGVSLTTVSLILNKNDQRISDPTRQRVLQAMERLAYTPSRLARGLPNRRANTLAVLVPALQNAFADVYFGEIISGIYEAAARAGGCGRARRSAPDRGTPGRTCGSYRAR
mgnify:CR=1 FL=1